jgi:16S rRNA (cytosine1402-N4)-methyltransferase
MYHNPVMLKESLEGLAIRPEGVYADLTFGGGGHTRAILSALQGGRVIAFDQDAEAHENLIDDQRLSLVHGNFRYVTQYLRYLKAVPLDGILADLGVSSHQIDEGRRGFSTRMEGHLDMRMDATGSGRDAATFLNTVTMEELTRILRENGDLPNSRKVAGAIIDYRKERPFSTTTDLREAVMHLVPPRLENKFLAQLFQAVRIAVNEETEALKEMLLQVPALLKSGGRLAIISYHSVEDRLVKHFMRSGNFEDMPDTDFYGNSRQPLKVITRKAIVPGEEETAQNNRARSARLRIAERI